jgi:hypothetical protein
VLWAQCRTEQGMQSPQGNRHCTRALTSVLFGEIEAPIPL